MSDNAVVVDEVWKSFRLYHEKNQYLKATVLKGRRAAYEEFWALKGVEFEVPFGQTFGVIGHNGSGKSTLLKCLAGILRPEHGSITHEGRLSALLELGAGFHQELTGRENVFLNGAILGLTKRDIAQRFDDIVSFAGLEDFIDTPVKNYSSGMFVRLGFAVAAHVEPDVLLIDEVLSVGDEAFQRQCAEKIEQFRRDGRTIVFVSHGLNQVEQLCERVAWIDHGKLVGLGPANEVITQYRGESHEGSALDGELGARWGTREAEVTSVGWVDDAGAPLDVITTLEPATLRLEYTSTKPLQNIVVGFRIDTVHGQLVWGTSTRLARKTIGFVNGPGRVDLHIDALPLLGGQYDLSVSITDESETHEYDHWERRVRFDVRQFGTNDAGLFHMPVNWRLDSAVTRD
ncbi:MAG: ABC transporter ATP-binding protein [Ilumatobacteraceae bacterium]